MTATNKNGLVLDTDKDTNQEKHTADSLITDGTSFQARVKGLPWQEALQAVQESWQLAVVIEVHVDNASPGQDTMRTRVGRMITNHHCLPKRRGELWQMIKTMSS